jgi:predicted regulator of amino acid metabolism with ACT domain
MPNTDKIIELAGQKAIDKENKVYEAISRIKSKNIELSITNIASEAGCSRKYIYSKPEIVDYIKKERSCQIIPHDTLMQIEKLEQRISNLIEENKKLKLANKDNSETYKQKYEKLKAENEELKKQLRKAYEYFPNDFSST